MPRQKEAFSKIREQSKNHILHAALTLFADNGVDGTSMSMIAKKAEVSIGLAYNYFKGKDDLLKELFASAIENLNVTFGPPAAKPTKDDCIKIMDNLISSVKKETNLWRLMVQIMLQPKVAHRLFSELRTMPSNPLLTFKRYFENKNDDNADEKADALTAMVIGVVLFYLTHKDETSMKNAFSLISKQLL